LSSAAVGDGATDGIVGKTFGGGCDHTAGLRLTVRDGVANALELLRQIISQQCEAEHDGGNYDAGNQPIFKGGDCPAI
jgi:hypothetical protein